MSFYRYSLKLHNLVSLKKPHYLAHGQLNVIYSGFNLNVERLTLTITIIVDSSRHNSGFVRCGDDNPPPPMNTREGSTVSSE